MEKVQSRDGTLIAYEKSGQGPPLVLVHGALATHTRWTPILPALETHFTVYAMDRRGRGESGDTPPYAIEREFEDVAAVVESIGDKVNVLGHSYGALCSLEAALLTSHIHQLVAYEPPPAPVPEGLLDRIETLIDADDREGAITTFLSELVRMPSHELERFKKAPVFPVRLSTVHTIPREFRAAEAYQFSPRRFMAVNVPTCFLLGGDSPAWARENIENWSASLPDSRIVVLAGQQHIAMDTAPDLFIKEVLAFLSERK